ncbi:MAG TPA: TetR/AcrR family transcriptional regulator [Steroidobacteraceae bacterium]|jgi:TetR/AcrR family transcriptional regulator|nr:TetR/AcrR family transcriptional regulator [Steroidobacteraceae bacterium]
MSYIAQRRVEEKERRRGEILDAAEALYAKEGWDLVTVDQVARGARLSRALVYVYFKDKEEILFAIGERAMCLLRDRFSAAAAGQKLGMEKIEAIGRAYMAYAFEFPHYFDFCSKFNARSGSPEPDSHDLACRAAGDEAIGVVVQAIQSGIADGSVRPTIGDPFMLAVTLWSFTHGLIQLAMAKGSDMARFGIAIPELSNYGFDLLRQVMQNSASAPDRKTT